MRQFDVEAFKTKLIDYATIAQDEPSCDARSIGQFLRFQHLIHIGLWSNGFGLPHHGNHTIGRPKTLHALCRVKFMRK